MFVSYRRQEPDEGLAHAFAAALEGAGHEVFIDTKIDWGAKWAERIREGLEGADFLLLLLSPEAAVSEMVTEELVSACELEQETGAPVVLPLRLRYPDSEPLPYLVSAHLRGLQHQSWDGPDDTSRLVDLLLACVGQGGTWAEVSESTEAAGPFHSSEPTPHLEPRALVLPGGAIDTQAHFYVLRQADEQVLATVCMPRGLVTVQGPRQSGKTSLILRTREALRQRSHGSLMAAFVDFQALSREELGSLHAVWRAITDRVAYDLEIEVVSWREGGLYEANLDRFLERDVLADEKEGLLLCLDEVDRVFDFSLGQEFFSSLRAFYNRGAHDASWKRVSWLLGTSSEPTFFIEDLNQSPFNVGLRVELPPFTVSEISDFGLNFGIHPEVANPEQILACVGGQPYLVHLFLYHLAAGKIGPELLSDTAEASRTIFREHLHRFLLHFQKEETLSRAMKKVVADRGCGDARLADRLRAAGLVRRDSGGKVVPLCELYADFFRQEL